MSKPRVYDLIRRILPRPMRRLAAMALGGVRRCISLAWRGVGFFVAQGQGVTSSAELVTAPTLGKRTAWVISFTGVSNEPRVLRQTQALLSEGWRVVVVGYDGHSPRPTEWNFVRLRDRARHASRFSFALLRAQRALGRILFMNAHRSPALRSFGARLYYDAIPNWRENLRQTMRIARQNPQLAANLVLAHDWHTSPVGWRLSRYFRCPLSIDCHEYARGQYLHDPKWVQEQQPFVVGMLDYYLSRADLVTTVCEGIAGLLDREQRLKQPAVVVRSVPRYEKQVFRPCGNQIVVLYHGDVSYVRGLHKAVRSMPLWRPEFRLHIRGAGDPDYIASLQRIAAESGVADRLSFEGPVPFNEIVGAANRADIGYFVHKDVSPQKRFVLPNKFFEYIMAGLALCVSDLPEMARIVRRYDLGLLVDEYDEPSIARVINGFSRDSIDRYKRAALEAAAVLNWEAEQRAMLDAYAQITG
ncbi:MAG: glycosyltransferase family 4 protein [Gammaproteobacteria bacterium]